jgi:hypothetical protein
MVKSGDDRNSGFGSGSNVARHKPGFEPSPAVRGQDGNHTFKHSDNKDVPQESLRDRLTRPRKGN